MLQKCWRYTDRRWGEVEKKDIPKAAAGLAWQLNCESCIWNEFICTVYVKAQGSTEYYSHKIFVSKCNRQSYGSSSFYFL